MTTNDIDAIRKQLRSIIGGPWTVGEPRCTDDVDAWEIPVHIPKLMDGEPDTKSEMAVVRYQTCGFQYPHADAKADAQFIAAARTLVPALCDEIEQLRAELAKVRTDRDEEASGAVQLRAAMTEQGKRLDAARGLADKFGDQLIAAEKAARTVTALLEYLDQSGYAPLAEDEVRGLAVDLSTVLARLGHLPPDDDGRAAAINQETQQ